ncbi:MoaD/ThiS family protein [Thermodesulfobacteriota bacterium]
MDKVRIEALASLAETLGIEGTSEEVLSDQKIAGDRSVRDLLNRLCTRYNRFGQMVFDINSQKLTGKVIIFFNGRDLDLVNGLDTELSDGDTLTFFPFIEGG